MEKVLNEFFEVAQDPYRYLTEWKARNEKRIIGVYPMHIPEEIIHAAGMLPVVMWRSNEPVTLGHAHITPYNCGLVRSIVDDLVKGKLSFIDGVITYPLCLQLRGIAYIIDKNAPQLSYFENLHLPVGLKSPAAKGYLLENFEKMRNNLANLSGKAIADETLKESILLYNKHRALLRRLYKIRRDKPGVLKIKEVMAIVQSSMIMPKEDHSRLLEELLPQLESRDIPEDDKAKVVLTGGICFTPQTEVMDIIESAGAVVVDDDLFVGYRYFAVDADPDKAPMEALMARYFENTPPDPTKVDWETDWTDYIVDLVNKNQAQGVISVLMKYCPPLMTNYPDIKRVLSKKGIHELMIEIEHEVVSLEQVRTRVESFVNILKGA